MQHTRTPRGAVDDLPASLSSWPRLIWLALALLTLAAACGEEGAPTESRVSVTDRVHLPTLREAATVASPHRPADTTPTRSPRSVEPATGTIAFVSRREAVVPTAGGKRITQRAHIWTMNADGSEQRQMLTIPAHATSPVWRPDSRKLAYILLSTAFTVDADGQNTRQVSALYVGAESLSWAPDGRRLAMQLWRANGQIIHILDTVTGVSTPFTVESSQRHPSWSPAGGLIAVSFSEEPIWGVRGLDPATAAPVDGYDIHRAGSPVWSPDGQWLAVVTYDDGTAIDILDASWTQRRRLDGGRGIAGAPSWSPDGSRLAFARWTHGANDIWTVDVATGEEHRLTTSPYSDGAPAWAP